MVTWGVTRAGEGSGRPGGADADVPAPRDRRDGEEHDGDERIAGRRVERVHDRTVSALSIPATGVTVAGDGAERAPSAELPAGEHLLTCRGGVDRTLVRFVGPATLAAGESRVRLSFPEPTPVEVGYVRADDRPTVRVEPTVEGVATAVTAAAAAHRSGGPERSRPAERGAPPLVAVGEETTIPPAVAAGVPDTGIELRLPRSVRAALVGAPLAYYLGATATVTDRDRAALAVDGEVVRRLDAAPGYRHDCAGLLRRAFYLDCLVRDGDPRVGELGLDTSGLRAATPGERLERYLAIPADRLDEELPEWHLSTYVPAEPDRAACLPHLLERLSLIYPPTDSGGGRADLLDRTLGDAYDAGGGADPERTGGDGPDRHGHTADRDGGREVGTGGAVDAGDARGGTAADDLVLPELGAGRVHAWLAPGTPVDACKPTRRAYENRALYDRPEELDVTVVLNDAGMGEERRRVAAVYRERAAGFPIDVTVRERLPRAELADVFETGADFVHYIGHCDDAGLRCPDGHLAASSLDRSRARTFLLNACGSHEQGRALVERGSVAGLATLSDVLEAHAVTVGTAFARLLVHGFCIERASQLARRRIVMGKDYTVVGDGTYALTPSPRPPVVGRLSETAEGHRLECELLTARAAGERYRLPIGEGRRLNGRRVTADLGRDALVAALAGDSFPVVHDGDLRWSGSLAAELRD